MVDTRPFLFPGYLFDICSGCLIFFEVVFKMRAGFFSFAIDHEYMAVEQDQAVIPAVLHGVAADGQPWAFHGTALAEQEGAVVIETGIDASPLKMISFSTSLALPCIQIVRRSLVS